jgi:hypothetical protein
MGKPLLPMYICLIKSYGTHSPQLDVVRRNLGGRLRGCSGLGFRRRPGFGSYGWENLWFPCTYDLTKSYGTH